MSRRLTLSSRLRWCAPAMIALAMSAAAVATLAFGVEAADPTNRPHSGYQDMSPTLRAMQDDDAANPGMLWVAEGESMWSRAEGGAGLSCAGCHGDVATAMKGVAARYPAWDEGAGRAVDLDGRINACRTGRQGAAPWPRESRELLAVSALIARASRGLPIAEPDPRLAVTVSEGRRLFTMRQGQLNLSCAQCHDDNAGNKLAGAVIPQGHPNGYPLYRLEWQSMGSLQRRLRNCLAGMRAETYPFGADELVALEAYLKVRARGLPMESPAVRP